MKPIGCILLRHAGCLFTIALCTPVIYGEGPDSRKLIAFPELFTPLTEPPCSYCATQHRKKMIDDGDLVVAWIRGAHNGGAIPVRHFLAGPRVINDTYGLFFYDPEGGYVAGYKRVMVTNSTAGAVASWSRKGVTAPSGPP